MASLKSLRLRINSVKATQKITSAMKMVAASKLRRAQERAEAARPYAERMEQMVESLALSMAGNDLAPAMLQGPPTRPATMTAASTGPICLVTEMLMIPPSRPSCPRDSNSRYPSSASTIPMKAPVIATTGIDATPTE